MKVTSEIGPLQKVMLYKPGKELEYLFPMYLEEMLFDEIPWLKRAQEEHDGFSDTLKKAGVEIYYVDELMSEILDRNNLKKQFITEHLNLSDIANPDTREAVFDYLMNKTTTETVKTLIKGLRKDYVEQLKKESSFSDLTKESFPFYLSPLPSMYFTRDHGIKAQDDIILSSMFNMSRKRETLFLKYLVEYHPLFASSKPLAEDLSWPHGLEGGDVLVLKEDTLIVGYSERTTEQAIEWLAHNLLVQEEIFKEILVVEIPKKRAYMHLDTVFTMLDYDKFLLYPGIKDAIHCYRLRKNSHGSVDSNKEESLSSMLEKSLDRPVKIIYSGEQTPITAAREQWGDSTNTLAIKPGKVICYNRNERTNEILNKEGIEVLEIEGSELVRGRGGPRCMSFPIMREPI
ncbi:arginine deiminase [Natranaerobius trueperi]|uniref:arginine deiminase n=1 Tax=Natranaerobius trueperi TaxID=759412 RepID=A0A226BUL4_9FIRM|nr:arginine deiminase [Natranaerobius trueperi]OWZ82663.1 arginine deiminase [Natranaerobius trueperi]